MTQDMCDWEEKWQPKCWGEVRHVFESNEVGISVLRVNKGFRCSRHLHEFRRNQFDVVSGILEIWEWTDEQDVQQNPNRPIMRHFLRAGDSIRIGAKKPHLFRVLQSGIIVEVYSQDLGPVRAEDIVRFDEGGKDDLS